MRFDSVWSTDVALTLLMLPLGGHQAASAIGSSCVNCAAGTLRLLLLCEPRILLPPCVPAGYYFQNVLAVAAGFNPYFDG